jgi:hypothetical protein
VGSIIASSRPWRAVSSPAGNYRQKNMGRPLGVVKDCLVRGLEFSSEADVCVVRIGISQVIREVAAGDFNTDTMTA